MPIELMQGTALLGSSAPKKGDEFEQAQWGEVRAGEVGTIVLTIRNATVWPAKNLSIEAMDPRVIFEKLPLVIPPGEAREVRASWRPIMQSTGLRTTIRLKGDLLKGMG